VRLFQLDHAPWGDELYHAIAASSLLENGTLHINGPVEYTRAWLYTALVAGHMALFGENLVVARIPAVIAGSALTVGLFLWLRGFAGRWAAWSASLLLCFAPISIYLSQQTRFYALHALLFSAGAVAVFYASGSARGRRRWLLLVGSAVCLALALHLQITTLVGLAAVGGWLLLDRAPVFLRWVRKDQPRRLLLLLPGAVAAAAAGGVALAVLWPSAVALFSYADVWAEANREYVLYYHAHFLSQYPTLWTLFPFAVLVAATRHPRPAIFLAVTFGAVLAFHSAAAWKSERYVFYVLPAFFAIWGLAIGVALPWLRQRLLAVLRLHPVGRVAGSSSALLAAALLFAAAGNRATLIAYRMMTVPDSAWTMSAVYRGEADWERALPILEPAAAGADVVVASYPLKAIYFLGRVDLGVSVAAVARLEDQQEFSVATREGVGFVSTRESLALVRACIDRGLIIVDERQWRRPWAVTGETADFIEARTERLPVPASAGILAFQWQGASGEQAGSCGALEARLANREGGGR
jgi:hypothetical protein